MFQRAVSVGGGAERRVPVVDGRASCWRIGSVDLDRCLECVYLLRMEDGPEPTSLHVVCTDADLQAEADLAW